MIAFVQFVKKLPVGTKGHKLTKKQANKQTVESFKTKYFFDF